MKQLLQHRHAGVFIIILLSVLLMLIITLTDDHSHEQGGHADHHGQHDDQEETPRGPHGGRLLQQGDFSLEITLYELGIPPEFRVYGYYQGEPVAADAIELGIKLKRLGGVTDNIGFTVHGEFLRGDQPVTEPHSFDVEVNASYQGTNYQWQFESFEGRTQISQEIAAEMGIKTQSIGPATINETLSLTGRVSTDPNRISHIKARFPGVIKSIHYELGDTVKAGATLAVIESNDSLQSYSVKAPIDGQIVKRNLQVGEATGNDAVFIIADLSRVWVELDVFVSDLPRIKPGQAVMIESLDGQGLAESRIDWVSPLAAHASQSVAARVVVNNPTGLLRPGQTIRAHVTVAQHQAKLAVKPSSIQNFRDFKVVFTRIDDTYEVRMLELGQRNQQWVEVISGIAPGSEYVTEQSYLIKADIEKSGASHDH